MLVRLLILLTIVPLVELAILLRIAEEFHWGPTIALVIGTGVLGAFLARREGLKALRRIEADLAAGVSPTRGVVEGVLILVAGLVLLTPGILTDLCGFALLVGPIRRGVCRRLEESFKKRVATVHRRAAESFVDVHAVSSNARDPDESSLP